MTYTVRWFSSHGECEKTFTSKRDARWFIEEMEDVGQQIADVVETEVIRKTSIMSRDKFFGN